MPTDSQILAAMRTGQPPKTKGRPSEVFPAASNGEAAAAVPTLELRRLGEFQILRPLGEGGMGSVYLGYQQAQQRQVAVKVLPDHLAANEDYVKRFHREAKS